MAQEIDIYEARTHFSALLQAVKGGKRYIITQRGEPLAELSPSNINARHVGAQLAAQNLLQFMASRTTVEVDINAFIEEGRD